VRSIKFHNILDPLDVVGDARELDRLHFENLRRRDTNLSPLLLLVVDDKRRSTVGLS
jgi:hypothetical protein